jgi:hypothetical protein
LIALTACADSNTQIFTPVVEKPAIEKAPVWMRRKCPMLKKMARTPQSKGVGEKNWEKDMSLYVNCATRHNTYVDWIEARDRKLTGK